MALQRVLVSALGFLSVTTILAGVLVLTGGDSPQPTPAAAAPGAPLEIPAVNMDSPITQTAQRPGTVRLPLGGTARLLREEITADGTLPIPQDLGEAAWWGAKLGADYGAVLLSGHVNWAGRKGPFDELWGIGEGQEVSVLDISGGRWVYRVSDIVTLRKDDLPAHAQELFGQTGPHRLVLVTCGGEYVGGTEGYDSNRVVTARLISRP